MGDFTGFISQNEIDNLDNMYSGDKSRDASSTIRGFMFQDLVMIEYLLEDTVNFVGSECIEDICAKDSDNNFMFVQVKYYPKSTLKLEEIWRDLYYQYLRMEVLGSKLKAVPVLIYHRRDVTIEIPKLNKIMEILNTKCQKKKPEYPNNPYEWLSSHVYSKKNKKQMEDSLFDKYASEESINQFLEVLQIEYRDSLETYQIEITNKLKDTFKKSDFSAFSMCTNYGEVLLGLALKQVQCRYIKTSVAIGDLLQSRMDFIDIIKSTLNASDNNAVVAYLSSIVTEEFTRIIDHNGDLESDKKEILDIIATKTRAWVERQAASRDGQYCILNTISKEEIVNKARINSMGTMDIITKFAECKEAFKIFLDYCWKIILDKYVDNPKLGVSQNNTQLDIQSYINDNVTDYISLSFADGYAEDGIILPELSNANHEIEIEDIYNRLTNLKPRKWYMSNSYYRGPKLYGITVDHIAERKSIINMDKNVFFIECMECVKIGKKWNEIDHCDRCIFALECLQSYYKISEHEEDQI